MDGDWQSGGPCWPRERDIGFASQRGVRNRIYSFSPNENETTGTAVHQDGSPNCGTKKDRKMSARQKRLSKAFQELRDRDAERLSENLQGGHANILFATFHV